MDSEDRSAVAATVANILDECRKHVRSTSTLRSRRKPSDRGIPDVVTDLDVLIEDLIIEGLTKAYPQCTTFSEERQGDPRDVFGSLCFVVDPIDGTSELLAGKTSFSISVALLDRGRVEVGVVDFPKRGIRYEARRGEGVWSSGTRLFLRDRQTLAGVRVAVTPRQRAHPDLEPIFARLGACELVDIRPITAKFAAIVSGNVDAGLYLVEPSSEVAIWDYAAAALMLEEAGGIFISLSDQCPLLDLLPIRHRAGWIASSPGLKAPLLAAIHGLQIEQD